MSIKSQGATRNVDSPMSATLTVSDQYGTRVDTFTSAQKARSVVRMTAVGFGWDVPTGEREGRFQRRAMTVGKWSILEVAR